MNATDEIESVRAKRIEVLSETIAVQQKTIERYKAVIEASAEVVTIQEEIIAIDARALKAWEAAHQVQQTAVGAAQLFLEKTRKMQAGIAGLEIFCLTCGWAWSAKWLVVPLIVSCLRLASLAGGRKPPL